jgi:hypothetical protein
LKLKIGRKTEKSVQEKCKKMYRKNVPKKYSEKMYQKNTLVIKLGSSGVPYAQSLVKRDHCGWVKPDEVRNAHVAVEAVGLLTCCGVLGCLAGGRGCTREEGESSGRGVGRGAGGVVAGGRGCTREEGESSGRGVGGGAGGVVAGGRECTRKKGESSG